MKKIQVVVVGLAFCLILAGYAELARGYTRNCATDCHFAGPYENCSWHDVGYPTCGPNFDPDWICVHNGDNMTCGIFCGDSPC